MFSRGERDRARFGCASRGWLLRIGREAEGIGQQPARIAGVEEWRPRIARPVDHRHAAPLAGDRARGIAPGSLTPEDPLLVATAVAREVAATPFRCEFFREPDAKTHLLHVGERDGGVARRHVCIPADKPHRLAEGLLVDDRHRRAFPADHGGAWGVCGGPEILDRGGERGRAVAHGRLPLEADEPHGGLVSPGIMPGKVTEAEHHARMHRGMVHGVDAGAWRTGPRDHVATRAAKVAERRPADRRICKHILGHRLACRRDDEPITAVVDREAGGGWCHGIRCPAWCKARSQACHHDGCHGRPGSVPRHPTVTS